MNIARSYASLALVIGLTISLPLIGRWADGVTLIERLPQAVNRHLVYQPLTLLLALGFLVALRGMRAAVFRTYFRKGDISAPVVPVPMIGLKPPPHQNWYHVGRDFALVITLVTAAIIYFQVVRGHEISPALLWRGLPFSLLFSLINSFVEESITRLGVIVALQGVVSDKYLPIISAAIFGAVHYWGSPGGVVGVLAAGFLGGVLAKSILETQGIFWAWFIHFLQDMVILTALFGTS